MKKILIFFLIFAASILISSCTDNSTTEPTVPDTGNLMVSSTPAGAKILIDGADSGFSTPHTFSSKDIGTYTVTLTLENYIDTSMNAVVVKDQDATVDILLTPEYITYGPVRIWESLDPSTLDPSGLSLKLGKAISISSSKDSSAYNDVYYDSDGFIVVSASERANNSKMTRETYFYVGKSNSLNDKVDSPVKGSTWTKSVDSNERNYIFLYDADGHYSKLLIVEKNDPSSVTSTDGNIVVKWIYNKAKDNILF